VADGGLRIEAPGNAAAFVERPIPAGAKVVCCHLNQQSDQGATWGTGMSLVWKEGKTLRVNLRSDGHFGVDDGGRQIIKDNELSEPWLTLAIELDENSVRLRATGNGQEWQ